MPIFAIYSLKEIRLKVVTLIFLALLCFVLFQANTGAATLISDIERLIPFGDKLGHFFIYGTLALLANFSCGFRYVFASPMNQWGSLFALIFSSAEEFSQLLFATRTFDLFDMMANFSGITAFTLLSLLLSKQCTSKVRFIA